MITERVATRRRFFEFSKRVGLGATAALSSCDFQSPQDSQPATPTAPSPLSAAERLATAQVEATQEAKSKTQKPQATPSVTKIEDPTPVKQITKEQPSLGLQWQAEIKLPSKAGWFGRIPEAVLFSDDNIFSSGPEGRPQRLTLKGEVLWRWDEQATIFGIDSKNLYVLRPDMRFFALDKETGRPRWQVIFPKETGVNIEWPLTITGSTVHIPVSYSSSFGVNNTFTTIEKQIGNILWKSANSQKIVGNTEKTLVITEGRGGLNPVTLKGLELLTVKTKWVTGDQGSIRENSFLIRDGILAYELFLDQKNPRLATIVALELDSGNRLWESRENVNGLVNVLGEKLYTVNYDENLLFLVDPNSGATIKKISQFSVSRSQDFIGEVQNFVLVSFESIGYTRLIDLSSGKEVANTDLRINRIVGVWQDTIIGLYSDPANPRSPVMLVGIDKSTAQRKYRVTLPAFTDNVILVQDKIVVHKREESTLQVLSAKDGGAVANYSITPNTIVRSVANHKDIVFVITENRSSTQTKLNAYKI